MSVGPTRVLSFSFDSLGEGEGLARGMVLKRDVCKLTSTQTSSCVSSSLFFAQAQKKIGLPSKRLLDSKFFIVPRLRVQRLAYSFQSPKIPIPLPLSLKSLSHPILPTHVRAPFGLDKDAISLRGIAFAGQGAVCGAERLWRLHQLRRDRCGRAGRRRAGFLDTCHTMAAFVRARIWCLDR